jgi:hypothetical protein
MKQKFWCAICNKEYEHQGKAIWCCQEKKIISLKPMQKRIVKELIWS